MRPSTPARTAARSRASKSAPGGHSSPLTADLNGEGCLGAALPHEPIQNVGPTAPTCMALFVGSTTVQVRSCAEPALFESGSISGSSWPVQLDVYQTNSCA